MFVVNLLTGRGNNSGVGAWCYLAACYQTQGGVYAKTRPVYFRSVLQNWWGMTENDLVVNGLKRPIASFFYLCPTEVDFLQNIQRCLSIGVYTNLHSQLPEGPAERNIKLNLLQSWTAWVKEHVLSSSSCAKAALMTRDFKFTGVRHSNYLLYGFKTPQDVLLFHHHFHPLSLSRQQAAFNEPVFDKSLSKNRGGPL